MLAKTALLHYNNYSDKKRVIICVLKGILDVCFSVKSTQRNPHKHCVYVGFPYPYCKKVSSIYIGEQISLQIANLLPNVIICGKSRKIGSFLIPLLRKSNVMGNELLNPHSQPPLFVGGILELICSTNGCIAVNGYVILILKIKFYNRIRKRFLIKNEVNYNAKNRRKD